VGLAPQIPENPFQHSAVLDPRTTNTAILGRLGSKGAILSHCTSVSSGPDQAIVTPSALQTALVSHSTKLNHSHLMDLSPGVQQLPVSIG
jgi:hypothetical protein